MAMTTLFSLSAAHLSLFMTLIAGSILFGGEKAKADRPAICAKAVSTFELNQCSERAWQAAEAKLNAAFATAIVAIRKIDQEKPYDRDSWEKSLRASQRAWASFRDADCKGLVPMSWSGGTGTTSSVLECMTTKTKIRTDELLAITVSR